MIYATLFLALACIILGGSAGYFIGRYHSNLLDKLKFLESREPEPVKEVTKPTITMGDYAPPRDISTAPDNRSAGLVETKTPERVAWEQEQSIEKEALGR